MTSCPEKLRFVSHFDRTHKLKHPKNTVSHNYVSRRLTSFLFYVFACWPSVFKLSLLLTSQKRDVTELEFLLLVGTTGNSPKFILSSGNSGQPSPSLIIY